VYKRQVTGHVISSTTNEALSDFIVRLAEVVRPPEEQGGDIFILDQAFSPGTKTDSNGIFIFENVDSKEYVIVVGDIERTYEVVAGENGLPTVWNALPDEVTNFGEISVSLIPADR
jgi:cAMP phosphodiesterase